MDVWRLGQVRPRKQASIGALVVCVDAVRKDINGHSRRFIGLVLDKSISVYKIQIVDSGEIVYWPMTATYLWKEI
jgi:cystathionine beta-lyase/cystathionine gamma-synthase